MAILVSIDAISYQWPHVRIVHEQSFGIHEGDRIGLVGQNGSGKTSLLDLIAKRLEPESGSVIWRSQLAVGVLRQKDELQDTQTVEKAVLGEEAYFEYAAHPAKRAIFEQLLADISWSAPLSELSGGQRRRVDLARVLVRDWDMLLLDEPTNHLDLTTIAWLADHLKHRWPRECGAFIVVTHDRWFLDEICTTMIETHDGLLDHFEGGYSAYIQQRVERQRQAAKLEEKRQNTLRKELAWLARAPQARATKPNFRVKAALDLLAEDPPLRNELELKRLALSRLGKQVFDCKAVSYIYPESTHSIIHDLTWLIGPGERIGILGENGAGKSTLLHLLTGDLKATEGYIKRGASVRLGTVAQELSQLFQAPNQRIYELLSTYKTTYMVDGKEQSPAQLAEKLGFPSRLLNQRLSDCSGGQKRRLALLCMLLEEPNVLILDEPGNDLDTDMMALLEDLLDGWPGTLLVVSHDRMLLERTTTMQYGLIDGTLCHLPRGIEQYVEHMRAINSSSKVKISAAKPSKPNITNNERKAKKSRFASCERRMQQLEVEIKALEDELCQLSNDDPSNFVVLTQQQNMIAEKRSLYDELETEWLELSELLGE